MNSNYERLQAEDAALLETMEHLDPGCKEYETAFKAHTVINKQLTEWARINLDERKDELERTKMAHETTMEASRQKENRRNNWFQVCIACIPAFAGIFGRVWASHILLKATKETYGMDQEKIVSKSAADVKAQGMKIIS